MLPFEDLSLWLNAALFAGGAVLIWLAGTRLSGYANAIAERTGVAKAFIGALLLGGITSLPEGATTITSAAMGSPSLAVNNIVGGIAMQVTVLAVADMMGPGEALSGRVRQATVFLQAALLILILSFIAAGITVDDRGLSGVGSWSAVIFGASIIAFFLIHRHRQDESWKPEEPPAGSEQSVQEDETSEEYPHSQKDTSNRGLVVRTIVAALVILVAGYVVARTGDALAEQTGLGQSLVGFLLLAVATSLPEVSTTLTAVRMGQYAMAFSNIFGANILDASMVFLADLVAPGGPILNQVGTFSVVGSLLGITTTAVYVVGLIERRRRTVLGMGVDSAVVLLIYVGGMLLLYNLR